MFISSFYKFSASLIKVWALTALYFCGAKYFGHILIALSERFFWQFLTQSTSVLMFYWIILCARGTRSIGIWSLPSWNFGRKLSSVWIFQGLKIVLGHFWHVGMRLATRAKHSWKACSVHYSGMRAHAGLGRSLAPISTVSSVLRRWRRGYVAGKMKTRSKKDGVFFEGEEGEIWGNLIYLIFPVMVPNLWTVGFGVCELLLRGTRVQLLSTYTGYWASLLGGTRDKRNLYITTHFLLYSSHLYPSTR